MMIGVAFDVPKQDPTITSRPRDPGIGQRDRMLLGRGADDSPRKWAKKPDKVWVIGSRSLVMRHGALGGLKSREEMMHVGLGKGGLVGRKEYANPEKARK